MKLGKYLSVGLLALSVALATTVIASGSEAPVPPPDLSGRWKLDVTASDDARKKMREEMEKRGEAGLVRPSGGGTRPEGGGGPAGPGGPGGGGPSGARGPGGREPGDTMRAVFEPPEELTITQSPEEVQVQALFGDLRVFRPTGKKYKAENGTVERVSEWKQGALLVETKGRSGQKVKETWTLAEGGKRLTITIRIDGGNGSGISLQRAYDRLPPAE